MGCAPCTQLRHACLPWDAWCAQVLLAVQAWPPTAAVREMATRIKNLKRGVDNTGYCPFIYVDLKKCVSLMSCCLRCCSYRCCMSRFLPPSFPEHVPVRLDEAPGNGAAEASHAKGNKKRLEIVQWLAAWDRSLQHL